MNAPSIEIPAAYDDSTPLSASKFYLAAWFYTIALWVTLSHTGARHSLASLIKSLFTFRPCKLCGKPSHRALSHPEMRDVHRACGDAYQARIARRAADWLSRENLKRGMRQALGLES